MSLFIRSLSLTNFRSYQQFHLDDIGSVTVFVGPNAVGKSNVIEAVQLMSAVTSFRKPKSNELVLAGQPFARVQVEVTDGDRLLERELVVEGSKRKYLQNGKAKRATQLKGQMPAVTFTPDDLMLVKGAHGLRRAALDQLGAQLNTNYATILRDFDKVLKHKNRLLKEEAPLDLLEAVNELYEKVGAQLTGYRSALFDRLLVRMAEQYAKVSGGEVLSGAYVPSWEDDEVVGAADDPRKNAIDPAVANERLRQAIAARTSEEVLRRVSVVGPTHDHIHVSINGMEADKFASQGQQRSAVLAWKLAEAALIEEMLGVAPIMLLDDVMSELDSDRRAALVRAIEGAAQAFITTTNLDYFDADMLAVADVVQLRKRS